jgi:hypothetical protein
MESVRRIITGRRRNKVGAFYSWKNHAHVMHDSDGEERVARLFEVHRVVRAFFGQPETLRIRVDGQRRPEMYTPDFLVFFDETPVRVEFKYEQELRPPRCEDPDDERALYLEAKAAKLRRHLRIAADAYRRAGLVWMLITDVRLAAAADPDTVDEIVANGGRPMEESQLRRLLALLGSREPGSVTLAECEEAVRQCPFPRGDVLARIQERHISIDLCRPISETSAVNLVGG